MSHPRVLKTLTSPKSRASTLSRCQTRLRVSRHDGRLVQQLWKRRIASNHSGDSLLLGFRLAAGAPAAPTSFPSDRFARCIYFFTRKSRELLRANTCVPESYLTYLRNKVASLRSAGRPKRPPRRLTLNLMLSATLRKRKLGRGGKWARSYDGSKGRRTIRL